MAQASDIFSHLRQNHGDLHRNHGDLHQNHGDLHRNHGSRRQNHGDLRQNHGHLHRKHGDLRQNQETCARIRRPAPKSGDLHRSSSNECCYSAAPAPSLCRTHSVILAAAKPGKTLSGIVTEVKSLTWDFAGSSTKWPENA